MTKVSIVGVEGSGKTVLMAVLGDKYQLPDAKGLFLSPSDQETFDFAKRHLADLRAGRWPSSTNGNRRLSWMLCSRSGSGVSKVCDLSLLDYPGEAFRLSFGRHSDAELAKVGLDAADVAAFHRHVQDSQILVLVVNLSVIVNAAPDDERAWETQWLVKAILDEASARGKRAALVFTRADAHAALIAEAKGLAGAMVRWLPQVASLHADIPAFAVAAVGSTVPSETGQAVPAPDFGSQGLEPFVDWLARTARGCDWRVKVRHFFRRFFQIFAIGWLLALVGGICIQHGDAICRTLSGWHHRCADEKKTPDAADGLSAPAEKSESERAPDRQESSKEAEDNPHAAALAAAIDEAARALDEDALVRAQMALQRGTAAFQQANFNGEPFTVLEPLRQRWCTLWNLLLQKQTRKNIENFQRNNPYSDGGLGF